MDVGDLQAALDRSPFHQWLGLKVLSCNEDGVEISATWREEWVGNPDIRNTHGGVLSALVDLAADWSIGAQLGRGLPTVDLQVDYHAPASAGDLRVRGTAIRVGRTIGTASAEIVDSTGALVTTGRGVYLTRNGRRGEERK